MSASFRLLRGPIIDNQLTTGTQDSGIVATTNDNTYFSVWRDATNYYGGHQAIVGRHFDANGNPLAGEVVLNPINSFGIPLYAFQPAAVRLPIAGQADGLAVSFSDRYADLGSIFDLYVVRTNANLVRLEDPILIAIGGASNPFNSAITSFADGSLMVAYVYHHNANDWDIFAFRVAANGSLGARVTLFDDIDNSDNVDLATLTNGNFVAVLQNEFSNNANDNDVIFTIRTSTGAVVRASELVQGGGDSPADETRPHVAALAGGGFVVSWMDGLGDSSGYGIRATQYDAAGNVVRGNILVNATGQTDSQQFSEVTALPDSGTPLTDGRSVAPNENVSSRTRFAHIATNCGF